MMNIDYTSKPNNQDIDFLTQQICQETPNYGDAQVFGFFIRNEKKEIIAGCNGEIFYESIHTNQLWVHSDYRRQGIGHRLMEHVHNHGRQQGCRIATIITMSFQKARRFYENLGYACDLERSGYIENSSCIFLRKAL